MPIPRELWPAYPQGEIPNLEGLATGNMCVLARQLNGSTDDFDQSFDMNSALRKLIADGLLTHNQDGSLAFTEEGKKYLPGLYMGG